MNNPNFDARSPHSGMESRYIVPRFVERTSQGIREYDPYAKLFEERVIFLGVQIDDASANDVMAQLLCLESMDPDRDISVYINSSRRLLHRADGHLRHHAVRQARHPDGLHGPGGLRRGGSAGGRHPGQADGAAERAGADPPAVHRDRPRRRSPTWRSQANEITPDAARSWRRCWPSTRPLPIEQIREDIERDKILTAEDALSYGLVDQITASRKTGVSA